MRISNRFQRGMSFLLACSVLLVLPVCGSSEKHQSAQELSEGYYWYEAVFLDTEDVQKAFSTASDSYPKYEIVPDHFHVTVQYKPEPRHEDLYGTPVTVHITGYASGTVQDPQENMTSENEGLQVELLSADEGMQALIDNTDKNWHITGSYTGAAKYTEQLNFSDSTPVDITLEGVFGVADSDGNIVLEQQD